jgi:hypothetical protein
MFAILLIEDLHFLLNFLVLLRWGNCTQSCYQLIQSNLTILINIEGLKSLEQFLLLLFSGHHIH